MEKEPQDKLIPKEGDIFKALTEKIDTLKKEKEKEKTPIDREEFLLRILDDRDFYQQKLNGTNDSINKLFTYEAIGVRLSFYEIKKSHQYGFDVLKRPVTGFVKEEK
jgi:hypothetical protein